MKLKNLTLTLIILAVSHSPVIAEGWERTSPFLDVRVQHEQIFVDFEGTLYQLQEVNGEPTANLLLVAKKEFGTKWKKRIIEDLPEVLEAAGHTSSDQTSLVLRELGSEKTKHVSRAKFTTENRREIMRRGYTE